MVLHFITLIYSTPMPEYGKKIWSKVVLLRELQWGRWFCRWWYCFITFFLAFKFLVNFSSSSSRSSFLNLPGLIGMPEYVIDKSSRLHPKILSIISYLISIFPKRNTWPLWNLILRPDHNAKVFRVHWTMSWSIWNNGFFVFLWYIRAHQAHTTHVWSYINLPYSLFW